MHFSSNFCIDGYSYLMRFADKRSYTHVVWSRPRVQLPFTYLTLKSCSIAESADSLKADREPSANPFLQILLSKSSTSVGSNPTT